MALTKVTSTGITDEAVTTAKLAATTVAAADIACNAVTTGKITDGTITASDLNATLDLSSKTVTLPLAATSPIDQNIALLGFKMAVNEGLTVFNLVDGVVDEFHDESGADEGEGSNDTYCASNDNYINLGSPIPYSAGFSSTAITEPDTSTTATNPSHRVGSAGEYTVPSGLTSLNIQVWGAGGGAGERYSSYGGGGGGYAEGTLAVTGEQVLYVEPGEGGRVGQSAMSGIGGRGGGHNGTDAGNSPTNENSGAGGGAGGSFVAENTFGAPMDTASNYGPGEAPEVMVVGGSGGGTGHGTTGSTNPGRGGGGGGGS